MKWQGTIDFARPIMLNGQPHGIERITSLSVWQASDEGRVVYTEDTGKLWVGNSSQWQELTPGGVGSHDHDDRYYTETELQTSGQSAIHWDNITNEPAFIQATDVTYENLNTNGDVGTGAAQVAQGNHTHSASVITYDNSTSGIVATQVKDAIDEIENYLGKRVKSIIYVDKDRTESYTPTGSMAYPYKTISDATAVSGNGVTIYVSEGTYTENIVLPEGSGFLGAGSSKTYIEGNLTTTNKARSLIGDISLRGNLTITGRALLLNMYCDGNATINGATDASEIEGRNVTFACNTGTPLTIGNNSLLIKFSSGSVTSKDGSSALVAESGVVAFDKYIFEVRDIPSANPSISLIGTVSAHIHQSLVQSSGGNAITSTSLGSYPHIISDCQYAGGSMVFNSSPSIIEGVHDLMGSNLDASGSALIKRPSNQISYDNSTSGMVSAQVKDAIDEVYSAATTPVLPSTSGLPVDTPVTGTTRFDETTNTLYAYNGTAWVSTVLS